MPVFCWTSRESLQPRQTYPCCVRTQITGRTVRGKLASVQGQVWKVLGLGQVYGKRERAWLLQTASFWCYAPCWTCQGTLSTQFQSTCSRTVEEILKESVVAKGSQAEAAIIEAERVERSSCRKLRTLSTRNPFASLRDFPRSRAHKEPEIFIQAD